MGSVLRGPDYAGPCQVRRFSGAEKATTFSYFRGPFPCYQYSMAAATHYHKSDGIKQQKFILSYFWRPEYEISITGLKSRCQGAMLPPETLGRICSLLLPASCGCQHCLACGRITPISAFVVTLLSHPLLGGISLCLSLIRTLVIAFRAHLNNSGPLLHLQIFSHICKVLFAI